MSFVHLHVHSEYSLLDGHSRIPVLVNRARDLGMPALALTDHGVMFGAVEFYTAATKAGIKPIIGCEMYVAPRSRFDKEVDRDRGTHHITVLAQNLEGYRNLCKLASISQLEGFYYKPRIDREVLQQYAGGLIVLSGCSSGPVIRPLREDQPDRARANLAWLRDLFPGRFFIELQDHEGFPELKGLNRQLIALAREAGVPLVATNDVHYVRQADAPAQDLLLCIGTSTVISDPKRMRMADDSYYLKSAEEMAALFGEVPDALASTLAIAEMVDFKMEMGKYHLPVFEVPEGYTAESYLRALCDQGLAERYPEGHPRRERALRQLDYELGVIHQMGFDAYFLIVWDLIRFALERNIWWNVRGSAAGSIVSYCLGLTQLDPLAHGLIFERFLNPGRVSMPDIDLDFPDDRRQEMIEYCVRKYGADRVAQIITFGTLGARAALRDVGRALDLPLPEVDRLARLVPAVPGKPVTLANVLDPEHEFHSAELLQAYNSEDYVHDLIDRAQTLEGIARHASTHAAGVVISDRPITDYAPLHRPTKGSAEGGLGAVVQYDMGNAEAIGMLKVDFLGLSTLTLLRRTCDWIKRRHGLDIELKDIPLDDPKIFELLSSGQVLGVFQVEGCLGGETYVGSRRIKDLFEEFSVRQAEGPLPWARRLKTDSCYLDSGRLVANEILKVIHSGVKPVFRLVDERGNWIKATADHCFLTQRGWVRLGDLDVRTDRLLVKTNVKWAGRLCLDCDQPLKTGYREAIRCKKCSAQMTSNPSRPEVRARISASKQGSTPWNKGLTAETAADTTWIRNLRVYNDSQRGLTIEQRIGPERGARFRAALSRRNSGTGNPMYGRRPKITKTYTKAGYREDLGHYVRSSWEADLARVFRYLGLDYLYEPHTFELVDDDGGHLTYTPDFYVPELDQWFEIKGWMDTASAAKIELFRKQYSGCELVVVDRTLFAEFQLQYADVVQWECPEIPSSTHWARIRQIEPMGEEDTYDIQMRAPGNNFVANGFIVHNSGMRQVLTQMRPTKFEHIIAVLSLYRPGPMEYIPTYIRRMHGEEPVVYKHPKLEPILHETYAIIVYQEDIIQLASQLAGYAPGEADTIRKAVGKKIKEKLLEHREKFIKGAQLHSGIDEVTAASIFDDIELFARYGFNKSHAADYAVITCQTAYLKAHYPVEYMTALMSIERGNTEKLGAIVAEARRLGIQVLPPSVNDSDADFCIDDLPSGPAIRFGLTAVKNVGEGPVHTLLGVRAQGGPFRDLEDFARRVDLRQVNRRALESLIKVDALSAFGTRAQLLAAVDRVMGFSTAEHRAADIGQLTLFGDAPGAGGTLGKLPAVTDTPRKEQIEWEKDLVGTYLGEHPLQAMIDKLGSVVTAHAYELDETMKDRQVTLAGMVTSIRKLITKKGDPMAFVMLEDLTGVVEVTVFPRLWASSQALFVVDKLLIIAGKVDTQGKEPRIIADRVTDKFTQVRSADRPDELPPPRTRLPAARPIAGSREQGAGSRQQAAGNRQQATPATAPGQPGSRQQVAGRKPAPPAPAQATPPDEPPPFDEAAGNWEPDEALTPPEEPPDWEQSEVRSPKSEVSSPPAGAATARTDYATRAPATRSQPAPERAVEPTPPVLVAPSPPERATPPPAIPDSGLETPDSGHPSPDSGLRTPDSGLPSRLLEVRIKRSGNLEYDKARVRTVHEMLLRYPGTDRFRLVLSGARSVQLDFPNDMTGYCAELEKQITEMLGPDSLHVIAD